MIKAINSKEQELLNGIMNGDSQTINLVYKDVLPSIIYWVKQNSGSELEARDIFQDAMIVIFKKLNTNNLELTCSLKTYLKAICQNLWLNQLRKNSRISSSDITEFEDQVDFDDDILTSIENQDKRKIFLKHFDELGESCKKVLAWFFEKTPLAEIALKMDTTVNYIKKKKFNCKEKLVAAIQSDTAFKELNNKS